MATCKACGRQTSFTQIYDGICMDCREKGIETREQIAQAALSVAEEADVSGILLTTETAHNLPVAERLEIISAECIYGMHIFKDLFTEVRNIVGGRSKAAQNTMREAKNTVIAELKREAKSIGADAVVGVTLTFNQFGNAPAGSMIMVVATGTAVKLSRS